MKEFTLKELTKRGCIRTKEKDFRDDGTKFKTLNYKGMEITYTKYEEEYFLSIRIDYYSRELVYSDIPSELFKLADEFNGCYDIDPDKVIENAEAIIKGLNEVEAKVKKELETGLDITPLKNRAIKEIKMINEAIDNFKKSEAIYYLDPRYEAGSALNYLHSLEEYKQRLNKEWNKLDPSEIRQKLIQLKEINFILVEDDDDYYIKQLNEFTTKYGKKN